MRRKQSRHSGGPASPKGSASIRSATPFGDAGRRRPGRRTGRFSAEWDCMTSVAATRRRALSLFVLLLVGCGEGATGAMRPPVELMPGMRSQQSPSEVRAWLDERADRLRVVEASDLPEGDKRPRFSVLRWSVDAFEYRGVVGELQVSFFNDQLMSVWFFPEAPGSLPEVFGEAGATGAEEGARDGLRVRIGSDYRGKPYIAYEDSALVEAMEAWISKYA